MKTKTPQAEETLLHLDPALLDDAPVNSRPKRLSKASLAPLMESIKAAGEQRDKVGHIITAIVARPHPDEEGRYQVAAGHRRKHSAIYLGMPLVPVVVREMTDQQYQEELLVENVQREDPDPRDEARALKEAVDCGSDPQELAAKLGKSSSWLSRRLKLLDLLPAIWKAWQKGELKASLAALELLATLSKPLQKEVVEDRRHALESRSELQNLLDGTVHGLIAALPFDGNTEVHPGTACASCLGCPHSTAAQSDLFDEADKNPRCLLRECYDSRRSAWLKDTVEKAEKGGAKIRVSAGWQKPAWVTEIVPEAQMVDGQFQWSCNKAKKKDDGAFPFLDLTANGKPKVEWRTSNRKKQTPTTKDDGSKMNEEEQQEAKQEDRRDLLQRRRKVIVWAMLTEWFSATTHKQPAAAKLFLMLAAFGTSGNASARWDRDPYLELREESELDPKPDLWASVLEVARRRLGDSPPAPANVEDLWEEMESLSDLLGFDLAKAKLEADEQLPAPKSWGAVDPHTLQPVSTS